MRPSKTIAKQSTKSTPASSQEVAALREELRASRVGSMLAARPDITPEMRALLAPQQPTQVAAFLAAVPPRKTATTAAAAVAAVGGEPDDSIDDNVPHSIVGQLNAYLPRKPIAARRQVEHDDAHFTVRIR